MRHFNRNMPCLNAGERDLTVRMIAVNLPVWDRKQTGLHSQCKVTTEAKRKNQRGKKLLFLPLNRCDGLIRHPRFLRWVTDLVTFRSHKQQNAIHYPHFLHWGYPVSCILYGLTDLVTFRSCKQQNAIHYPHFLQRVTDLVTFRSCKQQNAIHYPHFLQRVTDLVTFTSCKQQNASQYPHFLHWGYPVSCILYGVTNLVTFTSCKQQNAVDPSMSSVWRDDGRSLWRKQLYWY